LDRTANDLQIGVQSWYRQGTYSKVTFLEVGSTLTLKYLVTKDGTTPWTNTTLKLQVGSSYSGSTGTWSANGGNIPAQPGSWSADFGGQLTAVTDSQGMATFTLLNKDLDVKAKYSSQDVLNEVTLQTSAKESRLYTQFKPLLNGFNDFTAPYELSDIITFDIVRKPTDSEKAAAAELKAKQEAEAKAAAELKAKQEAEAKLAADAAAELRAKQEAEAKLAAEAKAKLVPSVRLILPAYNSSNLVDTTSEIIQYYSPKTKAWYSYIQAGSSITLTYLIAKDSGTVPLPNQTVELLVNAPYSGSNANWLFGTTKIAPPKAVDASFGYKLTAKSNDKGLVTFTIKNNDTKGFEPKPSSLNSAFSTPRLFTTFKPVLPGFGDKDADIDLLTLDVYAAPVVSKKTTTISCIKKGSATKKVTGVNPRCPSGYTKK
jgi:hypothetical protein